MDMNNKYYDTTDMRIVPQGSSSTNFKHLRVPQNSLIQGWGVVYFAPIFSSYSHGKVSMEISCTIYETTLYKTENLDIRTL